MEFGFKQANKLKFWFTAKWPLFS